MLCEEAKKTITYYRAEFIPKGRDGMLGMPCVGAELDQLSGINPSFEFTDHSSETPAVHS